MSKWPINDHQVKNAKIFLCSHFPKWVSGLKMNSSSYYMLQQNYILLFGFCILYWQIPTGLSDFVSHHSEDSDLDRRMHVLCSSCLTLSRSHVFMTFHTLGTASSNLILCFHCLKSFKLFLPSFPWASAHTDLLGFHHKDFPIPVLPLDVLELPMHLQLLSPQIMTISRATANLSTSLWL